MLKCMITLSVSLFAVSALAANPDYKDYERTFAGTMLIGDAANPTEYQEDLIPDNAVRLSSQSYVRVQNEEIAIVKVEERGQVKTIVRRSHFFDGINWSKFDPSVNRDLLEWLLVRYTDLEANSASYVLGHDLRVVEVRFVTDLRFFRNAVIQGTLEVSGTLFVDVVSQQLVAISVQSFDDSQYKEAVGRSWGIISEYDGRFARGVVESALARYFARGTKEVRALTEKINALEIERPELSRGVELQRN